jgi:CubicO group peptidase (beta-lactamase class C family)
MQLLGMRHRRFIETTYILLTKGIMMRIRRIALFSILLAVLTARASSQSLPDEIDKLLSDHAANKRFMGTVLVADKGKIIFSKGYGLADVDRNIPNTTDTRFMIGSISKQFTSMLVMQLVERGKVGLEDRLSDLLPEFPRDPGEKITVGMLLSHTSGLIFPEGIEKYYYVSSKEEYIQEFLKQLSSEGLRFEPGEGYGYSNAGYFLLAMIIEGVAGKSYEEVLSEQILEPLGMNDTGCDRKGLVVENRAVSYQKLPDRYITWNEEMNSYDPSVLGFGYGSMYTTVGDLFKFSMALSSEALLSREYLDIYLEMRYEKKRPPIPYISSDLIEEFFTTCGSGYVGEIAITEDPVTKEKVTAYWHDGTCKLYKSNHFHYCEKGRVIIVLSNCSFLCEGNEIVLKIDRLLDGRPFEHVNIKHSLSQYVSEDIATHAGIPAACEEFLRLKSDTLNFSIPGEGWLMQHGLDFAEQGDFETAILLLETDRSAFPDSWKVLEALGKVYVTKGDTLAAIQSLNRSLERNPGSADAAEALRRLEGK